MTEYNLIEGVKIFGGGPFVIKIGACSGRFEKE